MAPLAQDWYETYSYNGIGNLRGTGIYLNLNNTRPDYMASEDYRPVGTGTNTHRLDSVRTSVSAGTPAVTAGTTSYAYDLLGHLTRVTRTAGESESLYYAPGGELAWRQVGEKFVFYVGEYATVTARGAAGCGASCTPVSTSVELDAHVVFAGTRIASVKPSRTLYYYRTRLGSVIATSLGGGLPGAAYRYDAYGEVELVQNETDTTRSELGYTNALRLTGSLLHLKNRVYDTDARVFIQPDVVDRLRYAYVVGDPVNHLDPSGLQAMEGAATVHVIRDGTHVSVVSTDEDGDLVVLASADLEIPTQREQLANYLIGLANELPDESIGASVEAKIDSAAKWAGEKGKAVTKWAVSGLTGWAADVGSNGQTPERAQDVQRNRQRVEEDGSGAAGRLVEELSRDQIESAPMSFFGGTVAYKALRKVLKGTGKIAHHAPFDKRFAKKLGIKPDDMPAMAVDRGAEHQGFTNQSRALIPFGAGTLAATRQSIIRAAKQIYAAYPDMLEYISRYEDSHL